MKIHILGPSGSGTTTLGRALSDKFNIPHFDSDDFFWLSTDPPFTQKRIMEDRVSLLKNTLDAHQSWILSGSMMKWGDFLVPQLDLVIYLYVEKEIRIMRLKTRERKNFGSRIDPGNDMYENHKEFIEWASSYEDGGMDMRSRMSEEAWIGRLKCPVLRIDGEVEIGEEVGMVERVLKQTLLYSREYKMPSIG